MIFSGKKSSRVFNSSMVFESSVAVFVGGNGLAVDQG